METEKLYTVAYACHPGNWETEAGLSCAQGQLELLCGICLLKGRLGLESSSGSEVFVTHAGDSSSNLQLPHKKPLWLCNPITPAQERWRQQEPEAHWPACLTASVSFKFSETLPQLVKRRETEEDTQCQLLAST